MTNNEQAWPDYVDEKVSVKVVEVIQSYAKIVNETIWAK